MVALEQVTQGFILSLLKRHLNGHKSSSSNQTIYDGVLNKAFSDSAGAETPDGYQAEDHGETEKDQHLRNHGVELGAE